MKYTARIGDFAPWNDKEYLKDVGAPSDASWVWFDSDRNPLGFHMTSPKSAAELIKGDTPRMTAPPVGFNGRKGPEGFWVSSVPLLPYAVEMWLPTIDSEPVSYLAVSFRKEALQERYFLESTWPVLQFSLQVEDILSIRALSPKEYSKFRDPEYLPRLRKLLGDQDAESPVQDCRYAAAVMLGL